MRTPRPSSLSIITHCQCTTGAVRSQGWPSSSAKMPSWIAMTVKWRSTVGNKTYPSKFCLFLIMLPDILLLLVIFIPTSERCFSLHTPPLWSNQWMNDFQQHLRFTTWGGPLPSPLLQLWETLRRHWCDSGRITTSVTASRTLLGLGVMSLRRRIHSKYKVGARPEPPQVRRLHLSACKKSRLRLIHSGLRTQTANQTTSIPPIITPMALGSSFSQDQSRPSAWLQNR